MAALQLRIEPVQVAGLFEQRLCCLGLLGDLDVIGIVFFFLLLVVRENGGSGGSLEVGKSRLNVLQTGVVSD